MILVLATATIACWVVVGTKLRALLADRSKSPVIRDIAICTASLAGVFTLLLPPVIVIVDRASANLALLLNSLLGIVSITAFQTLLIASIDAAAVRRWWIGCIVIDTLRAILFVAAPRRVHQIEMLNFAPNYTRYPILTIYDALRLAWFAVIFANIWRICHRLARQEPSRSNRWGLRLLAHVGTVGLIYVVYETAYLVARFSNHPLPGDERTIGTAILSCIVLLVAISTATVHLEPTLATRLACRRIRPLWETVAASRIGSILGDQGFSPAQRLIRRRQENVDGLARIADYYDADLWLWAYRLASAARHAPEKARTIADAVTIISALHSERGGRCEPFGSPGVLSSANQDDLSWQIAVSEALRSSTLTELIPVTTGSAPR